MTRTPSPVPVALSFPPSSARQDGWGKLLGLTAGGAELTTAVRLVKDEGVLLSFELGGESFESLRARVVHAEEDDGHRRAELRFVDEAERRRLAKALTEVLTRS